MVLADVHCILVCTINRRWKGKVEANMNHYDVVTVFYSLQQAVSGALFNASFYTNFWNFMERYKSRFIMASAPSYTSSSCCDKQLSSAPECSCEECPANTGELSNEFLTGKKIFHKASEGALKHKQKAEL